MYIIRVKTKYFVIGFNNITKISSSSKQIMVDTLGYFFQHPFPHFFPLDTFIIEYIKVKY